MKCRYGIKEKLLLSFLLFSVLIVALLWILQVVFLDDVYRQTKIRSVRSAAEKLYGISDTDLQEFVLEQAKENGVCINIFDSDMNKVAGEHAGGQCVVHNISRTTCSLFFEKTKEFEQSRFESYLPANEIARILRKHDISKDFFYNFFGSDPDDAMIYQTEETHDCVLLCQVYSNDDGQERFVLLSAIIVPVDSTVLTIRIELILISIVLVLVSIFMAYLLSRAISTPLVTLNRASKTLPEGRFESGGITGYLEVEELSQTLSSAAEEISKVERLRQELVANVSHDLRTPLTLISSYSEAMRDLPGENTPENLQIIIDETHRLSELVSDLLDLSKMEAGMDQLKSEPIDMVSFVRDICNRYEKMTGFKGYNLHLSCSLKTAPVLADPVKMKQVVYNLINNAIHYCGTDRFIGVRVSQLEKNVLLEVIDHGQGIEEEKLNEIWDRYYRVDQNHKSASVGTGLGLSIVKKILTLHGARFGVESKVGFGSRFWFTLPMQK